MKSNKQKDLAGTRRQDRDIGAGASNRKIQSLRKDPYIKKLSSKVFDGIKKMYDDSGVPFYTADSKIISMYCFWFAVFEYFAHEVADSMEAGEDVMVVHYENTSQVDVKYVIMNKATDQVTKLGKLIGVTAYSRGKIADFLNASKEVEEDDDEF